MSMSISLQGGRVLTPDGALEAADVHIADGRIVESPAAGGLNIDCRGYCVLLGIVDVHGDAFELELHPRPGVDIAFPIAMHSVDRQLLANGITTAFHGLTISWEPGARSLDAGRRFMEGLQGLRPNLMSDHRVQLRWETFAHDAMEDMASWLETDPTPAVAFNDHTTSTVEKVKAGNHKKLGQWAQRAGVTVGAYLAEVDRVWSFASEVPDKIRDVADLASRQGAIEVGRRADIVVLDCSGPWRLVHTIAGGRVTSFGR